jgi:cystathionine beta-lyase
MSMKKSHSASFDFDTPMDRYGTGSIKWDKYTGSDVIPMWVADMDFLSPRPVMEALHRRVDHGIFGYTVPSEELVDAVVQRMETLYQWKVERDWLIWLPGLVTGLNVACRAVGDDCDAVMTTTPIYPPFLTAPGYSRKKLITVPMTLHKNQWVMDWDRLQERITTKTKLFILCSPHNPCGRIFTKEELLELAAICEAHGMVVCSDEIHCDLILKQDRKHIPYAALDPDIARRTITLMAPSKTFNIPGLGCSFAIISDPLLRKRFSQAMAGIVPHVNVFGYTAALSSYREGGAWLEAVLTYLRGNHAVVKEAMEAIPGLSMTPVEATYLAWIDTREANLNDPALFFEEAGVGLADGKFFKGEGFVRLNFACTRSVLREALLRMDSALKKVTKVENKKK